MAQVGRISGPLLEANLIRNGIDLAFRNDLDTTQLLYLDVNTGRIAVNNSAAAVEIDITGTTRTVDLLSNVSNSATIANFSIGSNNINITSGNIFVNAGEAVVLTNLETEQYYVSDNTISTKDTNTNIELRPNGTGSLDIYNSVNIYGNLHSTGNITLDGTITFGDALAQDTIDFNTDVNSDIVPDITNTYSLGSSTKRWNALYTNFINGQTVSTEEITAGGTLLNGRAGNIFYVAVNGSDTNVGDHVQGPLATIREALARADASTSAPVVVYIFPGEYQEELPLVVPANVSVVGHDIRNVVITPDTNSQTQDVFHLNGESTVQNLTIKDFYYDSINNTGYAFRFAPGAVISTRSPYIQNISVITHGTNIGESDPRGFNSGDAGKGAYINGAEMNAASFDASMLFHSCTFITPGVDAITMTNGVRVEWLNSFTYFADRGLYALDGLTGRTSQDGSTINYGAEIRSIGSANVYGNYGAVADGADTLMYLIQHNMAYIGSGASAENDSNLVFQANEIVELNSGQIHYVTTDHTGSFRVGDNFFIDFETGSTTVDLSSLTANSLTGIVINNGPDTTTVDGSFIETGNFRIDNNLIQSLAGDINVSSSTNTINLNDNSTVNGNLDITGNFTFDGALSFAGDAPGDALTFNVELEQDFNPNQTMAFNLGSPSKEWLAVYLNRLESGDFSVYDNRISTNVSNADIELRANGSGRVYISDSLFIDNNLSISGLSTLADLNITGVLGLNGNLNIDGNKTVSNDLSITQNISVDAAAQFEEISISGNVITTTTSNADLELRASGTGTVLTDQTLVIEQNLEFDNGTGSNNLSVSLNTSTDNANISNIEINDNYIETTSLNADLELRSAQDVSAPSNSVQINNNLTVSGATDLQSVAVTGLINHTGNRTQTGNYDIAGELTVNNIYVEDNFITTSAGNLTLAANQNISIPANNVSVTNNLTVSGITDLQLLTVNGLLQHTGNRTQTGNYDIAGELAVDGVYIEDNFITSTGANADLELLANSSSSGGGSSIALGDMTNIYFNDKGIEFYGTEFDSTFVQSTGIFIRYDPNSSSGTSVALVPFETTTYDGYSIVVGSTSEDKAIYVDGVKLTSINLTVGGVTATLELDRDGGDGFTWVARYSVSGDVFNLVSQVDDTLEVTLGQEASDGVVKILVPSNNVQINNNLTVSGITDLQNIAITGLITHLGNTTQTGNLAQTGFLSVDGSVTISSATQFEDISIKGNVVQTTISNSNLDLRASGSGTVIIDSPTRVVQDLFAASITSGNIVINQDLELNEIIIPPSIIEVDDNFISTRVSNADLELRADGLGTLSVPNNSVTITNNLTVDQTTDVQELTVTGLVAHTGSRIQTGNYALTGNLLTSGLVTVSAAAAIDDLAISGNLLSSTAGNLVLEASSTGNVIFSNLVAGQDMSSATLTTDSIIIEGTVALEELESSTDIQIFDNVITTTNSNSNLELRANGSGDITLQDLRFNTDRLFTETEDIVFAPTNNLIIDATGALELPLGTAQVSNTNSQLRFNTDDEVFEGYNSGIVTFYGVYSDDRQTNVTAHPTSNVLNFVVNNVQVANINSDNVTLHRLQVEDISINNNIITTNASNADLEFRRDGTGELVLDDLSIIDNQFKNNGASLVIANTGNGYSKITSTFGAVVPTGTVAERPVADPEIGDTRFNTDDEILEVWDGSTYVAAAGTSATISQTEFNDLMFEYTLIFG